MVDQTPRYVRVQNAANEWEGLTQDRRNHWTNAAYTVAIDEHSAVTIRAAQPIQRIQLEWAADFTGPWLFLGDAFERAYGDLHFAPLDEERICHWSMAARQGALTRCFGVAVQPNALCAWQATAASVTLWLDVRNGTDPLDLHGRVLDCCTLVLREYPETDTDYSMLHAFARAMCPISRHSDEPIIGINDWYYAYGANTADLIIQNAQLAAALADGLGVKPWVLIDDGWESAYDSQTEYNGGPWQTGNDKLGDMGSVAQQIKAAGAQAGLWFRPLLVQSAATKTMVLHRDQDNLFLDPSHPAVRKQVAADIQRFTEWGFKMIKHDFTTYDIFGLQGVAMGLNYFAQPTHFYDKTKTTAEIINQFYAAIRQAAGAALIIGCNTISHLSAGVFDIMRVGDDTSGRHYQRTRSRGVNSLAFRLAQNDVFYQVDGDCVGISDMIPWVENRKWLQVLAQTKTPLFISCDPTGLTAEMQADIRQAFAQRMQAQQDGGSVPTGLAAGLYPTRWRNPTTGQVTDFAWFDTPRQFYASFPYY